MTTTALIEKIAASANNVPSHAEVLEVRQVAVDELEGRVKRLLAAIGDAFNIQVGRSDWSMRDSGTDILMPGGASARYYHASGAVKVCGGIAPMDGLFGPVDKDGHDKAALTKMVEAAAAKINLRDVLNGHAAVRFERLWSIKAQAASREGKAVEPVLCRVVGAYRQFAGELPVWGPASIALKLAGGGQFDSLALNMREIDGKVLDRPAVLKPEQAARNIVQQLEMLMGHSKINLDESAKLEWAGFGYLSLPRRKPQNVLAPVYLAAVSVNGEQETQAYLLATAATEKAYMSLEPRGNEAPPLRSRNGPQPSPRLKTLGTVSPFGLVH